MKLWRWFGSLACLAVVGWLAGTTLSVSAQDKDKGKDTASGDKLEWKAFEKGKSFYQKLETSTTQDMKVMNQEIQQKQNQTFYLKWTAEDKDKNGNWVVTQEIEEIKMEIDIGGNKIAYDSLAPSQPQNPMTDFFNALKKLKLTLTIGPDLKIVEVKGQDELIKSLGKTNPQMEPLLKTILSAEALKQMAEPTWGPFPPKGDLGAKTWKNKSVLPLGPIGTYTTEFEYSAGTPDAKTKNDVINVKATLTYQAPGEKERGGLPFTIQKADLKSKKGEGSATFDRGKGRFESSTMKMDLSGDLKIEVGGMTTEVHLDQTQTATVTTMDQLPKDVTDARAKREGKKEEKK